MAEIYVNWRKDNTNSNWLRLRGLDFHQISEEGVYVLWHGGKFPRAIYVGQGVIAERLAEHVRSPEIWKYEGHGSILTSWASLAGQYRDGVERFLIETYEPYENEVTPAARRIAVNLLIR